MTFKIKVLTLPLLVLFFISSSLAAETTKLGWSTEQAQTWSRMKGENHAIYQRLKKRVDGKNYSDPF